MSARHAAAAVSACLIARAIAAAPDAHTLIARLAREAPSSVTFTEVRFSRLLREPLVVSGELGYLGAGDLDRRVTAPYSETTTIRGNTVRIEREGQGSRSMLLDRAPQLEGFLSAFDALLGGDSAALQETFSVTASGDEASDWALELVPLDDRARRRVSMIAIYGIGEQLRCVATIDSEQTGSVMLLGALPPPPISPDSSLDGVIAHCRAR